MKKILILVLIFTFMCSMLASCTDVPPLLENEDARPLLESADAEFAKAPRTVEMSMKFSSDSKFIQDRLAVMNMELPMVIDGENVSISTSQKTPGQSIPTYINVMIVDDVMYSSVSTFRGKSRVKATISEEQYQELMEEGNGNMIAAPEDFGELTVKSEGEKKYISCDNISAEKLESLNNAMGEMLDDILGKIKYEPSVAEVTFDITLNQGRYERIDMLYAYFVVMDGQSFRITMEFSAEISYDYVAPIIAPSDADEYRKISFDEFFN